MNNITQSDMVRNTDYITKALTLYINSDMIMWF